MFVTSEPKVRIRKLKNGDPGFKIQQDFMACDRAAIDIDPKCPSRYAEIIMQCYNNGWIRPVAFVTEKELTFIGLTQE